MSRSRPSHAVRVALTSSLVAAAPALAQSPPEDAGASALGEVVVTGSRLVIPNMESVSPVTSLSAADIEASARPRVEDILNAMPQVFAAQGSNISNGSNGTATVSLRGLGSNRTVVLVNGRRLHPGNPGVAPTNAADLNFVPPQLIDRVEILTGGASSVYGADAVAGVVNFVMLKNFEGIRVTADYGFDWHRNDNAIADVVTSRPNYALPDRTVRTGFTKNASVTLGMNAPDNRGNATFYATYRKQDPVLQAKYDYSACNLNSGDVFSCGGSSTTAPPFSNGRFRLLNAATGGTAGPNQTFDANGGLVDFASTDAFAATQAYNFGPLNFYQRPDERWTMGVFAHYTLNERAEVYTELMYMNDRNTSQIAPSGSFYASNPLDATGAGGVLVNCDNPFLSAAMVQQWCTNRGLGPSGQTLLNVGRRNVEGGGRRQDFRFDSYRLAIGVRGDLADGWSYDAVAQQGVTEGRTVFLNDFSWQKIQRALLVRRGANGQPACTAVLDGTDATCVPWNIFQPGGVTKQAAEYLSIPLIATGDVRERLVNANVTADLGRYGVQLPGTSAGLNANVGVEWRSTSSTFTPDEAFRTGLGAGQGAATLPIAGGLTVREVFTEMRMPLVEDRPGVHRMSLEAGYRYSDYDLDFRTGTWKVGLDWSPVEDVRLRGSYQRAVRVPNTSELYAPTQVALDGTIDPCAGATPQFTPAQCARLGVTAAQYGTIDNNPANQYNGRIGGNPNLQPETAKTKSFGIALQPRWVPGLRVQADWFDIRVDDAIQPPNPDFTQVLCGTTGNPTACGRVQRDANGSLLSPSGFVEDLTTNIGFIRTTGVDVDASYRFGLGAAGHLGLGMFGTYLKSFELSTQPGVVVDCAKLYGPICSGAGPGAPAPKWRHTLRANWETPLEGLDLALAWRYFSAVDLETTADNPFLSQIGAAVGLPATDLKLGSRSYLDFNAGYRFAQRYSARLTINNLLDKDPPLNGSANCPTGPCNGNTWPQTYDTLGRFVSLGVSADF